MIQHESLNNLATSEILLIFSFLSASLNPKSLFNPNLILSPSNLYEFNPLAKIDCSNAQAIVDLPLADKPVNHTVTPFVFLIQHVLGEVKFACQVILVAMVIN